MAAMRMHHQFEGLTSMHWPLQIFWTFWFLKHLWHWKINTWQNSNAMWVFPKIVVPQRGWFIMEIPIKVDDLGVPPFSETLMLDFVFQVGSIYSIHRKQLFFAPAWNFCHSAKKCFWVLGKLGLPVLAKLAQNVCILRDSSTWSQSNLSLVGLKGSLQWFVAIPKKPG